MLAAKSEKISDFLVFVHSRNPATIHHICRVITILIFWRIINCKVISSSINRRYTPYIKIYPIYLIAKFQSVDQKILYIFDAFRISNRRYFLHSNFSTFFSNFSCSEKNYSTGNETPTSSFTLALSMFFGWMIKLHIAIFF